MAKVEVKARGIKNRLKTVKPYRAIAEYIWNGIDAGASTVEICYGCNAMENVTQLSIKDDGEGIPFSLVDKKFTPVLSSEKADQEVQHSLIHGKNGLGRLTFFHFAQKAKWKTCYQTENKIKLSYEIAVDADNIDNYLPTVETQTQEENTGTTVSFENIFELSDYYMQNELKRYLQKEFAWFLELKKDNGVSILINGTKLEYENIVQDRESTAITIDTHNFEITFIRWASKLNRHYSRYYCKDQNCKFKYSRPTTLNNRGDEFYHSVYITSEYFENFTPGTPLASNDLLGTNDQSDEFKELIKQVNEILRTKRKPFIVDHAKKLVEEYEKTGIFPEFNSGNRWEQIRHEDLKETVVQLYQVEPKIFTNLNNVQKRTLISFIALSVDKGEIGDLFDILDGVISLNSSERATFARQLKTTKMSSIVNTIELISDRYKSVAEFKRLVFEPSMYAGEVPHLQKMMEKNYWLIGEEYLLLTAAEPKFEEALRRYTHLLHGTKQEATIDHQSKNREMDIFLVRQGKKQSKIENVVLELKHPVNVRLGKKQFDQIYDYYQVIKSVDQFNASNMEWKFYLIANDFDSTGYIDSQIQSHQSHGEPGLIFVGEYKVYAFKWSEIFIEFELKHEFLNRNLKLELERLSDGEHEDADDIVNKKRTSDAPIEYEGARSTA